MTDGPPCFRNEWLEEGAARDNLTLPEAASLLAALSPLLREDNLADAAGTAAIAIFRLLGKKLRRRRVTLTLLRSASLGQATAVVVQGTSP